MGFVINLDNYTLASYIYGQDGCFTDKIYAKSHMAQVMGLRGSMPYQNAVPEI